MAAADHPGPLPDGQRLRTGLAAALQQLVAQPAALRLGPPPGLGERAEGHFHLVPELFLQLSGHTQFQFPQGACHLAPGQALLLPPLLQHAEQVQADPGGRPFCNLVIQADSGRLTCHLAHEASPGRPGILHLESVLHEAAGPIQDWLAQAARLSAVVGGRQGAGAVLGMGMGIGMGDASSAPLGAGNLAAVQAQALVCAATAAALRALGDAAAAPAAAEPPLVARLRVLVQNQLGDAGLSVRRLAAQSGCTADHLSAVFARATGEPLAACITRLRLARAADLLRQTDMPCKQVAWACGYARHSYFSHCFRRQHGVAPQAWRAGLAARR